MAVQEMKCNVEIEYAAELDKGVFDVLQVRPISSDSMQARIDWDEIDTRDAILNSSSALGTGWINGIQDVIYLKESAFDTLKTVEMAAQIRELNARMRAEGKPYALIGYGRWGSSIPSLGVPVVWSDISEARVIVECSLPTFRVDPSQGTHFFQNLTSFNAGYVNVDPFGRPDDSVDLSSLDSLPASDESAYLRHVRLPKPLRICVDGFAGKAFIGKNE
jgi:hypothetical protein